MAPPLHSVIRQALERRETQNESIQTYLEQLGDLRRYDGAFQALWKLSCEKGIDPTNASMDQVAQMLLLLNALSASQARHAYSACLLIPGLDQLRFHPLLRKCKKEWNHSGEKYATFWDAKKVLEQLLAEPLNWK